MADFAQGGIVPGGRRDDITPPHPGCDYVIPKSKGGLLEGHGTGESLGRWHLGEWVINRDGTGQQVVKIADGKAHFGPVTQLFDPDELREASQRALARLNTPQQHTNEPLA